MFGDANQHATCIKMQDTQKLESLGVLAGGIAHDFNNLLTGILGNASVAASDIEESSKIRGNLEQIERGDVTTPW